MENRSDGRRKPDAASTVSVGEGSAGRPLSGFRAAALGPWLVDGATSVESRRHDGEQGVWLDIVHDGWRRLGLKHARRLFLDLAADELRGEDSLIPMAEAKADGSDLRVAGADGKTPLDRKSVV